MENDRLIQRKAIASTATTQSQGKSSSYNLRVVSIYYERVSVSYIAFMIVVGEF